MLALIADHKRSRKQEWTIFFCKLHLSLIRAIVLHHSVKHQEQHMCQQYAYRRPDDLSTYITGISSMDDTRTICQLTLFLSQCLFCGSLIHRRAQTNRNLQFWAPCSHPTICYQVLSPDGKYNSSHLFLYEDSVYPRKSL